MQEKNWKVELSREAWRYLEKLEKRVVLRITNHLENLGKTENPSFHKKVKPLIGKLKGFYRMRIGDLRVIFEIDWKNKRIGVLTIVPRGNAY